VPHSWPKLLEAKWGRTEENDIDRWLGFVVEVGRHERHLHSVGYGAGLPREERDEFWIRELVPECIAAAREALAREQTGEYVAPRDVARVHRGDGLEETPAATVQQVQTALAPVQDGKYRSLVADVIHAMEPDAVISVGGAILGLDGARTVDVQVWSADRSAGPTILDVIDQPDGIPVGIDAVDHIESKRRDLPVRAALVSSNTGFAREAISKAKRVGVGLITVFKKWRRASAGNRGGGLSQDGHC